jgi:hypothetical protein
MTERLLVNYWYAHPVGHAIEGLRYALGYYAADPELRVSLLLNAATPVELAQCCPFLDEVYAVPFADFTRDSGDPRAALAEVPREWHYVVDNFRIHEPSHQGFRGFRSFFEAAHEHFEPRHGFGITGAEPPVYAPDQQLRLELPEELRDAARRELGAGRRALSVILSGHSEPRSSYPSLVSWEEILGGLSAHHPDAAILLIGKLGSGNMTSSSTIGRAEVDRLLAACPAAIDCFDRPLLEQLALVEASDLFVSPHTGFAFAALAVGTPWLALSGGAWHEYFFNGVPFYSVLPDTRRYPCFTWDARMEPIEDEDSEGPRAPSMTRARIREDLPELLHAADLLIEKCLPYEEALADYFPRLLDAYRGDRSRIFTFDNIHERYLPPPFRRRFVRAAPATARISLPSNFAPPITTRALRKSVRVLRRAARQLLSRPS